MMAMGRSTLVLCLLFGFLATVFSASNNLSAELLKAQLKFPNYDHFRVEVFADSGNLTWFPRSILLTPRGNIFVASYGFGGIQGNNPALTQVYAIVPSSDWSRAERIIPVTPPLWVPNGIGFYNGSLYVAQINKLWQFPNIEDHLDNVTFEAVEIKEVSEFLPNHTWHGWRYIKFSPPPEEKLYFAIGAPCNVPCNEDCNCLAPPFGTIMRFNPRNWTEREVFAHGIRNTLGFDWHPTTGEFWFTDNGRDAMDPDHNNRPPDELNRVTQAGRHYGFPFCYGKDINDPAFYNGSCSNSSFVGAAQELGAHVAALGLRFYTGDMFPDEFKNSALIAEHGSWDRQPPSGYRISLVQFSEDGQASSYTPFLEGWIQAGKTCANDSDCPFAAPCQNSPDGQINAPFYCGGWGRPADLQVLPDGSVLVTDEVAGVIWRVTYEPPKESSGLYWLIPSLILIGIVVLVAISEVTGNRKSSSTYHRIES